MTLALPRTFKDGSGEVASGKQVMENLNALKAALDPLWTAYARVNKVAVTSGTEYELSATRPGYVLLDAVTGGGGNYAMQVYVGGVLIPGWGATFGIAHGLLGPFPVPPGQKWKAVLTNVTAVYSSWTV